MASKCHKRRSMRAASFYCPDESRAVPVDRRIKQRKAVARFIATVMLGSIAAFFALCLCGCVYKGAKVTEGTDLAIGLNVPVSEGTLQLQVLNYLSGFRLGVDRNAILTCHYTVSETNSYFGCVTTRVSKTMDATVEPCEVSTNETNVAERVVIE